MRRIRFLLVLALFAGALYIGWQFAAQNGTPVRVHWVIGETAEVSLWKVLLVTFAAGAACTGIGWMYLALKSGLMRRRYRRVLAGLESEIHQLRNLPLAPDPPAPGEPREAASEGLPAREPLGRGA
ncbi:MAG: LapA family protein [Myxococcales bacterium]|nr:LapA family protein [Myxococcales bacterium]MDH5307381.1 LapA family protein [Myxococcales bacterium]MDH5567120.1 LapA family protein [Myxococcales bacterium]